MPSSQTIVVGDIHGCFEELQQLLDIVNFSHNDELISIGDLVDRGPHSKEVVAFFMQTPNAFAIMGNHEDKQIRIFDGELEPSLSQTICLEQWGDYTAKAISYFRTLPLYLYKKDFLLVHAGVLPYLPPSQQPKNTLLRARMPWMKGSFDKRFGGWWKYYNAKTPVVYGHSVFNEVHIENNTYGIDTGACHGQKLSAIILESREIIQVQASRDHWKDIRELYLTKITPPK